MRFTVYLAGGFKEKWRDTVVERLRHSHRFLIPLPGKELKQPPWQYAIRDLLFVRQADIMFVFISKNKKYAMGTAAEMGYAKALNKPIIYIQDKENPYADNFEFMKALADVVFYGLEEGIRYLETLDGGFAREAEDVKG